MSIGIRLLKMINPVLEDKRMELRHAILQAEACAEDLTRTVQSYRKKTVKSSLRGNGKERV